MTGLETLTFLLYMMSAGFVVGIVWAMLFAWIKW